MDSFFPLLRSKLIIFRRQIKDNLFTLFLLGPMILGFVYLIAAPYLRTLALGRYSSPSSASAELLAVGFIFLLLLASASQTAAEIYPLQSADSYLDALPIGPNLRFIAIALERAVKNLPLIIVVAVIDLLITRMASRPMEIINLLFCGLLPALLQITALQIALLLAAAHFGALKLSRLLPIFGALFAIAAALPSVSKIILFPIAGAKNLFISFLGRWFGSASPFALSDSLISVACAGLFFSLAFPAYKRWAVNDREAVERAISARRSIPGLAQLASLVERLAGASISAQLVRDLTLTFRFFSSAVYLSIAIASLLIIAFVVYVDRYKPDPAAFEIAVLASCASASLALASLAPALIKHQLAYLSIDRALPIQGIDMYKCKLWYARLLSLAAPIACFIIAMFLGSFDLAASALLLVKMLLVWALIASITGALSFEILSNPDLAIPFIAIANIAVASVVIQFWGLWFILYPYIMDKLEQRARLRAHMMLIGVEGDDD